MNDIVIIQPPHTSVGEHRRMQSAMVTMVPAILFGSRDRGDEPDAPEIPLAAYSITLTCDNHDNQYYKPFIQRGKYLPCGCRKWEKCKRCK